MVLPAFLYLLTSLAQVPGFQLQRAGAASPGCRGIGLHRPHPVEKHYPYPSSSALCARNFSSRLEAVGRGNSRPRPSRGGGGGRRRQDDGPGRQRFDADEDEDPFCDFGGDDDYFGDDDFYGDDNASEDEGKDYGHDDDSYAPRTQPLHNEDMANSGTKSFFFSKKPLSDASFSAPALAEDETFQRLCSGAGITKPSRIQALAWPVLLQGKPAIVADQTGSGKTLAYLLPLIQRMKLTAAAPRINGAPKILVLAPTAELADQVREVCDRLSRDVRFRTMVTTATGKYSTSIRDQIRMLQNQRCDVLISTPGRIATILRTKNSGLDLTSLQAMVLDEVDILLIDETFGPQLRTVGAAAPVDSTQFVFVTATLPDTIVETVEKEFSEVTKIRGSGLHRVAPTVKENLVDVSVPSTSNRDANMCFDIKAQELQQALNQNRCDRTLIFCNTVENCRKVENLLRRKDKRGRLREVSAYHNAMTPEARNRNLQYFARGRGSQDDRSGKVNRERGRNARKNDDAERILICTDRAARGVDFDAAPVDHVILFDFPKDPAEYVRRVGRTARAGRTGTSTVFAYGWQLPIVRKVMGKDKLEYNAAAEFRGKGEDDENYEYRGGAANRGKNKRKREKGKKYGPNEAIKGNIESGKLWGRSGP